MHTIKNTSKIILLDSIRSMQNVGAIMRNCDGAGFEKIILCGFTPCLPRKDIQKTALGAEKRIDWEYYENAREVLKKLQTQGYRIYSLELDSRSRDYKEFFDDTSEKVCLVVGNELAGVSSKILDISDAIISIPMLGEKASLNVSVAAGIAMYSFVK